MIHATTTPIFSPFTHHTDDHPLSALLRALVSQPNLTTCSCLIPLESFGRLVGHGHKTNIVAFFLFDALFSPWLEIALVLSLLQLFRFFPLDRGPLFSEMRVLSIVAL